MLPSQVATLPVPAGNLRARCSQANNPKLQTQLRTSVPEACQTDSHGTKKQAQAWQGAFTPAEVDKLLLCNGEQQLPSSPMLLLQVPQSRHQAPDLHPRHSLQGPVSTQLDAARLSASYLQQFHPLPLLQPCQMLVLLLMSMRYTDVCQTGWYMGHICKQG